MHNSILRYIDEVARQRSIRKAARVLNVASTAVNRQILKLEEELGTKLFERVPEGVELTSAGAVLVMHARKTLFDYQRAQAELADIRGMRVGHVRLSMLDSFTFELVPAVLDEFFRKQPGVTYTALAANSNDVVDAVACGEVDFGLGFTQHQHPDLRIRFETPTPFGAVVLPNHPLAGRAYVTLEECIQYPIVRTHDPVGKAPYLEEEAKAKGLPAILPFYTNSMVLSKRAIQAGLGIGIFTKVGFTKEVAADQLRYIPLVETALAGYKMGVFIPATRNLSSPAHFLVEAVGKALRAGHFTS